MKKGQKKGGACTEKQKIWTVMRGLGSFTIDDLIALTEIDEKIIRRYISKLHTSGYLRIERKERMPGMRLRRVYRLIKNTGPYAPFEVNVVYDPNIKEVVLYEGNNRKRSEEKG